MKLIMKLALFSLGCLLAMRVAEIKPIDKLYLVAGWDFDTLTEGHKLFWKTPIDHKKIIHNSNEIYCFSSDHDPYTSTYQAKEMAQRLNGEFILIEGAGHFTNKDGITEFPEILKYI